LELGFQEEKYSPLDPNGNRILVIGVARLANKNQRPARAAKSLNVRLPIAAIDILLRDASNFRVE
jgi:hypothetical protein